MIEALIFLMDNIYERFLMKKEKQQQKMKLFILPQQN